MEEIKKCCKLDKKTVWVLILAVYVLASAIFIIYVFYQNFKVNYIEKSYADGQSATIQQIITQAQDETCQPFYVYTTSERVQLINTACLTTTVEQTTNTNQ